MSHTVRLKILRLNKTTSILYPINIQKSNLILYIECQDEVLASFSCYIGGQSEISQYRGWINMQYLKGRSHMTCDYPSYSFKEIKRYVWKCLFTHPSTKNGKFSIFLIKLIIDLRESSYFSNLFLNKVWRIEHIVVFFYCVSLYSYCPTF